MPLPLDLSLYYITPEKNGGGRSDQAVVEAAIAGGATIVQLRKKEMTTRRLLDLGEALRELTRQRGIPLIINDRIDLALALGADGVHLGEDDMPVARARKLLGPEKIIGKTARTVEQARQARAEGADYLGAGAVFPTGSKHNTRLIGLEGLQAICRAVELPVVAVAGINTGNAHRAVEAGAAGVAVISCLAFAGDVKQKAAALKKEVAAGKRFT